MGIRVDAKSLDEQLTKAGCDDRRKLPFHQMMLKRNAAADHGRWNRPVSDLHAAAGKSRTSARCRCPIWDDENQTKSVKHAGVHAAVKAYVFDTVG